MQSTSKFTCNTYVYLHILGSCVHVRMPVRRPDSHWDGWPPSGLLSENTEQTPIYAKLKKTNYNCFDVF